ARAVAEDLHLDVPRLPDPALEVDRVVLVVALAETLDGLEQRRQLVLAAAELQTDAAAAGRALDHHREADAARLAECLIDAREQPAARQERHVASERRLARGVLEPEHAQVLRTRTDEADAFGREALGEGRVLGQE